jgi:hypothetical protein
LVVAEFETISQQHPVGGEERNEKRTVRIASLVSKDMMPGSPEQEARMLET